MNPRPDPNATERTWLLFAAIALAGVGLRVAMAFESFWLDEAWSVLLARSVDSPWQIFTDLHHDNNHILNTLYLYAIEGWVGHERHWFWFRLPSLIAGILLLGALGRVALRWGRVEASATVLLAASSYPLIQASAQARGYAVSLLCAVLYFWLAERVSTSRTGDRIARVAMWAVAAVGLLAHLTFVYALAAVAAGSLVRDLRAGAGWRVIAARQVGCHAVPALCLATLYIGFYSDLSVGGGPAYDRMAVVRQAFAQTMALPRRGPATVFATLLGLALCFLGLFRLWRAGDSTGVFFVAVLFVAPALVVLVSQPPVFYARYLLACYPWFYLLAALGLAAAARGSRVRAAAAGLVLAWLVLQNAAMDVAVLRVGRNDYANALEYIDSHSDGAVARVGSDHDFRNGTLFRFYAPRLGSGRRLEYRSREQWPPGGPEWYLRHNWRSGRDPERRYEPAPGLVYELVESFEHGPGDGFQWYIYRRVRHP